MKWLLKFSCNHRDCCEMSMTRIRHLLRLDNAPYSNAPKIFDWTHSAQVKHGLRDEAMTHRIVLGSYQNKKIVRMRPPTAVGASWWFCLWLSASHLMVLVMGEAISSETTTEEDAFFPDLADDYTMTGKTKFPHHFWRWEINIKSYSQPQLMAADGLIE